MSIIPLSYYRQSDVVFIARDLLGKKLCTQIDGEKCCGIITETEAYRGWGDKACHASGNRRTERNKVMYEDGGHSYVYLCYGIHHLFNIVTNVQNEADAVLVRAIEPVEGIETMLKRRNKSKVDKSLSSGPGTLSQALGIDRSHYGLPLNSEELWLEDIGYNPQNIIETTRIGVDYAGDDALLPWRFYIEDSIWVSKR